MGLPETALRQTALELVRQNEAYRAGLPYEPLDVDAIEAWTRIAMGDDTDGDLALIAMRVAA